MAVEQDRLAEIESGGTDWQRWGTYVSDRAWGTVREDYSADGNAWDFFPHDHARSRAYRWNEDALAGWCDREQHLCLGLALWNERDPILKERLFGLTNRQGNHGEDVKEYYFYLDNTPTHSYARMLYKYPQVAFPYAELVTENGRRGPADPEYELIDALRAEFEAGRYFDVFVEYAKVDAEDTLCRISVVNRGPDPAPIHLLPHLWYRNTWAWTHHATHHILERQADGSIHTEHPILGERWWYAAASDGQAVELLFTENDTNTEQLFGAPNATPYVKDAFHAAVVDGRRERIHSEHGSKAAAHLHAVVPPGGTFVVQVRLARQAQAQPFANFDETLAQRRKEADEFYAAVQSPKLDSDALAVQRQAFAGLLWSKQFYHYDIYRWLTGDPTQPPPPEVRWERRNRDWLHLHNSDIILMPDKWEYPWYALWDLAFHAVTMALIDPNFAKGQLKLLTGFRYQHPYGAVPAYEWDFGDVNPPLLAWAAWQVYQIDRAQHGQEDLTFLESIFEPLIMMAVWWLNRKDEEGDGIFGGGFLGMDNIGVFDRDQPLPLGGTLEQSDGTGWVAMFLLHMTEIALELSLHNPNHIQMVRRFGQDFILVANALENTAAAGQGLWDPDDNFYHDIIRVGPREVISLDVYAISGLVPLLAGIAMEKKQLAQSPLLEEWLHDLIMRRPALREQVESWFEQGTGEYKLLSVVYGERLSQILQRLLDENQFLSPYGIRSLSREHLENPYRFDVEGRTFEVKYLPGVSDNRLFGGNSNWRGPIWLPINFILIQSLNTYARFYGDTLKVECPTGSGHMLTLAEVGDELAGRVARIFARDPAQGGRRAVFGDNAYFQNDPNWRDYVPFHEYFHGDDGSGLGASHQTGWTALIAVLLQYGGALHFDRAWKE
ncbi:MAG: glucosidase [Anaerolineae bacterium]